MRAGRTSYISCQEQCYPDLCPDVRMVGHKAALGSGLISDRDTSEDIINMGIH